MKRATLRVASVEITCPCGANLAHPETGSFLWDTNENRFAAPFTVVCAYCGQTVEVRMSKTLQRISY
ncbi:MAG TPA: hypothetical protein VJS69_01240 [Candidatus Krumholzibacteria bacterium]|nr:hypothetical protein [Candidatus Krumholzibacteria bacterium]